MALEPPYYPIVYVRGFAATLGEIEDTVATPYMGFNLGSTKVRQDYEGDVVRFIFESPLIRLMKDHDYSDVYRNGDLIPADERVSPRSIWIFRYYEPVSESLGDGERREIPRFASDLREFVLRIRDQVCGDDQAARDAFQVHLVAHSMGGLICRCYLQNICRFGVAAAYPELSGAEQAAINARLELDTRPAAPLVNKVFTYATPHNGIEFGGFNVPDLGGLDRFHARNFNRDRMRDYLALPADAERVDSLNGAFPEERFFSLVGTNYRDYDAFFGLSKRGTGQMSDGLVMMRNATVAGTPRAFVHRTHGGHYGIVNSEEGYQNLRRFLFGDVRVDVTLVIDEITLPQAIEEAVDDQRERVKASYLIETSAALRGLQTVLTERRVLQESAILRTYEELVQEHKSVYLFSGCLLKQAKMPRVKDTALAFAVELGVQVPVYEVDRRFWMDAHFEGGYVFKDTVTFHVRTAGDRTTVRYGLASSLGLGAATKMLEPEATTDGLMFDVPLGFREGAANPPRPGLRGRLRIEARDWDAVAS